MHDGPELGSRRGRGHPSNLACMVRADPGTLLGSDALADPLGPVSGARVGPAETRDPRSAR